jgi:hypothetical protein
MLREIIATLEVGRVKRRENHAQVEAPPLLSFPFRQRYCCGALETFHDVCIYQVLKVIKV